MSHHFGENVRLRLVQADPAQVTQAGRLRLPEPAQVAQAQADPAQVAQADSTH